MNQLKGCKITINTDPTQKLFTNQFMNKLFRPILLTKLIDLLKKRLDQFMNKTFRSIPWTRSTYSQKSLDSKEWFIHDRINLWRNHSEWFHEPDQLIHWTDLTQKNLFTNWTNSWTKHWDGFSEPNRLIHWPDPTQINVSLIEPPYVSHNRYTFTINNLISLHNLYWVLCAFRTVIVIWTTSMLCFY